MAWLSQHEAHIIAVPNVFKGILPQHLERYQACMGFFMIKLFALLALFSSLFSATVFAEERQTVDNHGYEAFHVEGLEKLAEGSSGVIRTQTHSFYQLSSGNLCYATDDSKLCYELSCPTQGIDNKLGIVCQAKMNSQFLIIFHDEPRNMKNGFETTVKTVTGIRSLDKKFSVKIERAQP
ncbi:hypothetical protein ACES2J_10590 [Bdellovibrio bacteriovorus]|uniref:hypothetical protein n=1 Tax=Bdellovibrio bacteriovorus TaxID=959 RepID=UPI0035A682A6